MKRWLIALLLLVCSTVALAQDITIRAPSEPIQKGSWEMIIVTGLSAEEFEAAAIEVSPSDGVSYQPNAFGRFTSLWFKSTKPGKYTVSIGMNRWRQYLNQGAGEAKKAGIDAADQAEIDALVTKLTQKYPSKFGTAQLEVAGSLPPPGPTDPTDPSVPIDPSKKVTQVTYVYEKDQNNVPPPVSFGLQRINQDSLGSVVASAFEEDTIDGSGQVPDQYAIALEAARKAGLPALVVQSGQVVLKVVKDPKTEQSVAEAIAP